MDREILWRMFQKECANFILLSFTNRPSIKHLSNEEMGHCILRNRFYRYTYSQYYTSIHVLFLLWIQNDKHAMKVFLCAVVQLD